jgi:hypothetical protein
VSVPLKADITQVVFTINPLKLPKFALVLETTLHPVYPAEKFCAAMLISLKFI